MGDGERTGDMKGLDGGRDRDGEENMKRHKAGRRKGGREAGRTKRVPPSNETEE